MNMNNTVITHEQIFGERPQVTAYSPGRVNIIGEHVDYCDGMVLPFAISMTIVVSASLDESGFVTVYSAALDKKTSFPVDIDSPAEPSAWENYIRGMVHGLRKENAPLPGARIVIDGNLEPGSGMSSSAALCVSVGMALARLVNVDIPRERMAQIAQASEHKFAGTPCGIMDQMAVCFGKKDHALLIDCRDLSRECVPCRPDGVSFLVIPSGVRHTLVDGAYEKRVISCREAVKEISKSHPEVKSLRDVDAGMLEDHRNKLDEETYIRARHVVSEMARVISAVEALKANDWQTVGQLLRQTQASLRDDYQVSCKEIDQLIDVLHEEESVLGARMVGGGFGGIVLAVVLTEQVEAIQNLIDNKYYKPNGISENSFIVEPSAGADALICDEPVLRT